MKKALIVGLSILLLVAAAPSYAGKTIKFNNQKAGQLCKSTEVNLSVNLPTGAVLTCLKANSKAKPKWAKTKSQISTPTRNPIISSPMPTPNPSTTIKDGVPKQGQVCTANSADVIGYDLNGKFTDLMCNQFDNRYFPRPAYLNPFTVDPTTGLSTPLLNNPVTLNHDSRFKYENESCTPDRILAPQLQWKPGVTLDGTQTFLMCNSSNQKWGRIYIEGNNKVSFPFEEPSLTGLLPNSKLRLSDPSTWDSVSTYMQQIDQNIQTKSSLNELTLHVVIEPGDNGEFTDEIVEELKGAIIFYNSINLLPNYKEVYAILGRSQQWIAAQVSSTCHSGWSGTVPSGVAVGTCEIGIGRGELVLNVPGIVTGYGLNADSNIELSKVNRNITQDVGVRLNPTHEFFHLFQFSNADAQSDWYQKMPLWFTEGAAQTLGLLSVAKTGVISSSYLELFKRIDLGTISAGNCIYVSSRDMNTTPGSGCQYSLGILAVETLMSKHGGFDVIRELVKNYHGESFASEFERITGITLDSFYAEVDNHAKTLGYIQI